MSDSDSVDLLDSSIQMPAQTAAFQLVKSKKAAKKRKASTAELSSASDNESSSSQTSAYYLQKAVDYLKLAANQETDESIQTKIKSLIGKTQLIFLNFAEYVSDSESDSNTMQSFKADVDHKFHQIHDMFCELKSATAQAHVIPGASNSVDSAVSQSTEYTNLTGVFQNLAQQSEKETYAQVLGRLIPSQDAEKDVRNSSRGSVSQSAAPARGQSNIQSAAKNAEKLKSNSAVKSAAKFSSHRDRRLILLNSKNTALSNADSMELRDKINTEFQKQLKLSASKPVIAAIVKSYKQQNIVLITMTDYNADFLIQHANIWQNYFKFSSFLKDKAWFKVIAHGIPTGIFNISKGLDLLTQEIITFNEIQPIAVNWLSSAQNRQSKMHASVVIAFDNEAAAQKALKNRLFIAGISVRTAKFEEHNAAIQCQKCQKLDHSTASCKNLALCQFCAQNHPTRLHTCKTCETVGEICVHTVLKCSNCNGNHAANSKKECNLLIAAAEKKNKNSNADLNSNSNAMETDS